MGGAVWGGLNEVGQSLKLLSYLSLAQIEGNVLLREATTQRRD